MQYRSHGLQLREAEVCLFVVWRLATSCLRGGSCQTLKTRCKIYLTTSSLWVGSTQALEIQTKHTAISLRRVVEFH